MKCPIKAQNEAWLIEYCAQRLDSAIREELEAHLEQCPECRVFVEAQARAWTALDEWQPAAVSSEFDQKFYVRLREQQEKQTFWSTLAGAWKGWQPALAAAGVSVVLIAVLWVGRPKPAPPLPPPPSAEMANVVDADRVEKTLDDLDMLEQLDRLRKPDEGSM